MYSHMNVSKTQGHGILIAGTNEGTPIPDTSSGVRGLNQKFAAISMDLHVL